MAKFYDLEVKEVRKETGDCVSVAFNVPEDIKAEFNYLPGQYLTLRAEIDGEDTRRSYSICSSSILGEDLRVAIKKVVGGTFSTYANEKLKQGDVTKVMPPMGNFIAKLDPKNEKRYVAFAAGSGITPIISIVKSVLEAEPNSQITLFYGNQNSNSIIFKEDLEDIKNIHLQRFELYHILSREDPGIRLFKGRIDKEKCGLLLKAFPILTEADEYFICGPEDMINNVQEQLRSSGISEDKVHFELFTSPVGKLGKTNQTVSKEPVESFSSVVRIILDGDETEIGVNSDGLPILDAALKNGMDVPFACKGAVCCTCKAKVLEGKVRMDMNYSLEDDELEAGYILTCQAHPESPKVVVDYDS